MFWCVYLSNVHFFSNKGGTQFSSPKNLTIKCFAKILNWIFKFRIEIAKILSWTFKFRKHNLPKFYTFSNSPNIDWSCLAFDIYNIKAWSIEKVFPLKLIVKRWNSNGVNHQRFRHKEWNQKTDCQKMEFQWCLSPKI